MSQRQLEHLEAHLNVLRLNIRHLAASITIEPAFDFPRLDLDEVGSPAEAARQVRRLCRVPSGPIVNLVRMIEDLGILIIEQPFDSDRIDALSIWGPGEHPVILCNSTFPPDRKRHTLAHEMAHLILHASDVTADPEREADEFAAELLMPEATIRPELRNLRLPDLPDIKRRWKVSMRSIVTHARNMGAISKDQARYMYMRLNQQYGAKREPVELPVEPPTLLSEMLQGHISELGYSVTDLAAVVRLFDDDFEDWYGLRSRHLHAL